MFGIAGAGERVLGPFSAAESREPERGGGPEYGHVTWRHRLGTQIDLSTVGTFTPRPIKNPRGRRRGGGGGGVKRSPLCRARRGEHDSGMPARHNVKLQIFRR